MRLHDIIRIIMDNLFLGIIGVIAFGVVMYIGYFVLYRKLLSGMKVFTKRQLFIGGMLAGYVIMVLGVTFLDRGTYFRGQMNLHFLSSYREAWNRFSVRHWQFVILNIVMFVPLGILLPLFHRNFRKAGWTIGAGLLFTITIESLQLITGRGSFVLDDIFNNTLGATIGYGIIMGVFTLLNRQQKKFYKMMGFFSPLLIVTIAFIGIFLTYNLQEFGKLSIASSHTLNMKNTQVTLNVELDDKKISHPIFQAPVYTRDSATDFVVEFLQNLDIDTSNLQVNAYNESAIYSVRGNTRYNVWINYMNGTYRYTDLSHIDEDVKHMDTEEEVLVEKLDKFGIKIPEAARFNKRDIGSYEWIVDKNIINNQLIDGVLSVVHFNDGTIKQIMNNLVVYNKIRNVPIKNEIEAYQEIMNGSFSWFYSGNDMETINVYGVELGYHLDSKGFYQPVYLFGCTINEIDSIIIIPALLR